MNDPKFTPGPWKMEPGDEGDFSVGLNGYTPSVYVDFEEEGQVGEICRVLRPIKWSGSLREGNLEQEEYGDPNANARLIAAAPKMYAKLRELLEANEDGGIASWATVWNEVEELLEGL